MLTACAGSQMQKIFWFRTTLKLLKLTCLLFIDFTELPKCHLKNPNITVLHHSKKRISTRYTVCRRKLKLFSEQLLHECAF